MTESSVVMIDNLDLGESGVAGQVLDLQRLACRAEAELIGFDGIPPLHESIDDLRGAALDWLGIRDGERIVAAMAMCGAARPGYPDALFDLLSARCGLGSAARVLELGPGTGQATVPPELTRMNGLVAGAGPCDLTVPPSSSLMLVTRYSPVRVKFGARRHSRPAPSW